VSTTRTRMTREQRHEQLLELGMQAVVDASFDALSVEQVADAAGISRGLLFHYFPTRRDFLVAIAEAGAAQLLEVTAPDPDLDPIAQLRTGMAAFVDYIVERRKAYVSLVQGAAGGDPAMLQVVRRTRQRIVERLLAGVGLSLEDAPATLRLGLHGWLGFVEEAAITWLESDDAPPRQDLLDLCERMFVTVVADTTGLDLATLAAGADT
jgi:AcrR family transcriptional regulator